jgi:hypothetical protein
MKETSFLGEVPTNRGDKAISAKKSKKNYA